MASPLKCSFLVAMILSLWSVLALAQDTGVGTINSPPYVPSACYGYQDQGVMIAAASEEIWDGGAACGRMYQVTCTGATNKGVPHPCISGSVTVKITDLCPSPGCKGVLDLSHESFSIIASPDAGGIKISYQQV